MVRARSAEIQRPENLGTYLQKVAYVNEGERVKWHLPPPSTTRLTTKPPPCEGMPNGPFDKKCPVQTKTKWPAFPTNAPPIGERAKYRCQSGVNGSRSGAAPNIYGGFSWFAPVVRAQKLDCCDPIQTNSRGARVLIKRCGGTIQRQAHPPPRVRAAPGIITRRETKSRRGPAAPQVRPQHSREHSARCTELAAA